MKEEKIIHKELSYQITGLLFKAHKDLGRYRNEKQYADYFEKLLHDANMQYVREHKLIDHRNDKGRIRCICDFIIDNKIIVEFKAKNFITKEDYFQVKRYLATINLKLAIIANFRQTRLYPKRVLNNNS